MLFAVTALDRAAAVLSDRYGLTAAEGGRHPQWGTANRIVPVGDAYLELIGVVDPNRAGASSFGRWVTAAQAGIMRPFGWAVRTSAIGDVARRLDLTVEDGSRATADGRVLTWKTAGASRAAADPTLPFFIEWGAGTPHPSQMAVTHEAGPVGLDHLNIVGDRDRLAAWLGDHDLPVRVEPGRSAVTRVVLKVGTEPIVLDAIASENPRQPACPD